MAKRRVNQPEKPKTVLIKPREVFKKELLERIALGEELYKKEIQDTVQLSELKKEAASWDDYNEELVKRSFNNQDSEYFYEYYRLNQMVGMLEYAKGINTDHPSYKLKLAKDRIDNCVTWLKRLVEKLPLIEEDGAMIPYLVQDKIFYNKGFAVHGHDEAKNLK
jgi:ABC-type proline/glycine betaine transport system ATPase subunit